MPHMGVATFRARARWWMPLVGGLAALLGGTGGCGHGKTEARQMPGWVFESSRLDGTLAPPRRHPRPRGGMRGRSEASDFVVAALQDRGLRFGTDGSVGALWGYLRDSHGLVRQADARPGDVVFFDIGGPLARTCHIQDGPDHVGIVSHVDVDGRIAFIEVRGGRVLRSYVHPHLPQQRRDTEGRILNSFLRPKRIADADETPTFAGEMFCGAARPTK